MCELVVSQRRWGKTRPRKFLSRLLMSDKKTIGSMTDRQRFALAVMLTACYALTAT